MVDFLKQVSEVVPSKRQLQWFDTGFYAFIHFGMNTFTDREWGDGTEDESLFAPKELDCEQWAKTVKEAGMKGMILTAKHHDGFCLWPSKYTEHCVKNAPCKRDVVKEAADACRKYGLRFGVYLSPWDRNNASYGSPAYNDYYCHQLEELLTGYGELFCVWFDGACGEGPNGKKQEYDFDRYIALIRKYQPNAVIFFEQGPDIRWCGNEAGKVRVSEWAVIPSEIGKRAKVQTGPGPLSAEGTLAHIHNTDRNLGMLASILYSKGLTFLPAEVDTSIRPGWFWHEKEEPKSVETLFRIYVGSVGGNTCLNLNIPPNRDGLLDERDIQRLRELRDTLDHEFGSPLPAVIEKRPDAYPSQPEYVVKLTKSVSEVKYVELREEIEKGQRVEAFKIEAMTPQGSRFPLYQGTTIGNRKICMLTDPFAEQNRLEEKKPSSPATSLLVRVTAARGEVSLKEIVVY